MFGYVMVNKDELKIKEYNRYRSYYCGLCSSLRKNYGIKGQLALSYDMTFLVILLTSLYEKECKYRSSRCITHPIIKHDFLTNEFSEYAAHMTILLSYQNQKDDWADDKNYIKLISSSIYKHAYQRVKKQYKRQGEAVEEYINKLHEIEASKEHNLDSAAGATGIMLREIFIYNQDEWSEDLGKIGFFLGKFIYLLDPYDDIEKDIKKYSYNPLLPLYNREDFNDYCKNILIMMMSECAKAFERLPMVEDAGILRNIIYSGVFSRFEEIKKRKSIIKEVK